MEHISPDCICTGKRCKACEQLKCLGAFRPTQRGVRSKCKWCSNIPQRANGTKYRQDNAEHIKAYQQDYYGANTQTIIARIQVWNAEHSEHRQAYLGEYYQNNKAQIRIEQGEYYTEHQEQFIARANAYRAVYPQRVRDQNRLRTARKRSAGGSMTRRQWEGLKVQYSYSCLRCGKTEPDIKLTIDHIIPVIKGGSSDISNIQPLCRNCNNNKRTRIIDYRTSFERTAYHA